MIIEIGQDSIVPYLARPDIRGDNQCAACDMMGSLQQPNKTSLTMIAALCFGMAFGFPFIAWGIILMIDRDRTWQRKLRRAKAGTSPRRSPAWDRRQVVYGVLLSLFGAAVFVLLATFNFLAQGISPPAPY